MTSNIINLSEVRSFFINYCEDMEIAFSEELFNSYLSHLETDWYDWLRENARSFGNNPLYPVVSSKD